MLITLSSKRKKALLLGSSCLSSSRLLRPAEGSMEVGMTEHSVTKYQLWLKHIEMLRTDRRDVSVAQILIAFNFYKRDEISPNWTARMDTVRGLAWGCLQKRGTCSWCHYREHSTVSQYGAAVWFYPVGLPAFHFLYAVMFSMDWHEWNHRAPMRRPSDPLADTPYVDSSSVADVSIS